MGTYFRWYFGSFESCLAFLGISYVQRRHTGYKTFLFFKKPNQTKTPTQQQNKNVGVYKWYNLKNGKNANVYNMYILPHKQQQKRAIVNYNLVILRGVLNFTFIAIHIYQ